MIVPSKRLVWCAGLVVLPLLACWPVFPAASWVCGTGLVAVAAVLLVDGWRGGTGRGGTSISVRMPGVVRLSLGRAVEVPVTLCCEGPRPVAVRVGFAWPAGISASPAEWSVAVPAGEAEATRAIACTATRRGLLPMQAVYWETASPWGCWLVRRRQAIDCQFRAYPDLLDERRQLAAVFLHRGGHGVHTQRLVGRGREFEKLRDYVAGDSMEDIHWKTTAKRGRPVTKTYQVERTQEVYVVVDHSRLSGRWVAAGMPAVVGHAPEEQDGGAGRVMMLERFLVAALVLGLAAGRQGDLFGLLTFSDKVGGFLRARSGRAHFDACRDALLRLEARPVTPDFEEMFTFVRLRLRRRALLVVLTALDDPLLGESFSRSLELVQRQHLVLVNLLRPEGVEPLFTKPDVGSLEGLYESLGGHMRWHGLRALQQELQHRGVRLSLLDHERLCTDLVQQYLQVKQRQQL